jgi:LCP family protein required for cell wall assembly
MTLVPIPDQSPAPSAIPLPTATARPIPSATPTAQPKIAPTLARYFITPPPDATIVTPIPTPVAAATVPAEVINILLIGTDSRPTDTTFRTDTLIVASINKHTNAVTLLSIPRDLYVYIPYFGMGRINQAYGAGKNYPEGAPALIKQTLLYNLGVPIHYYALVNFTGFRQIVNALGGIDVPVTCQLTEYKLRDWALDEADPANYDLYTQTVGLAHMDGDIALWYARARPVGGDFFRSYRQRQVLRAIYRAGMQAGVVTRAPELYGAFKDVVQTDLGLWEVMQFVPMAPQMNDTTLRTLAIGPNQTTGWTTPRGDAVLLPRAEPILQIVADLLSTAPVTKTEAPVVPIVEIWNVSAPVGTETLAAETLRNDGFAPTLGAPTTTPYTQTTLIVFAPQPDEATLKHLKTLLHLPEANVVADPQSDNPIPYRVLLGADYNPCPRLDWIAPSLLPPTAAPTPIK